MMLRRFFCSLALSFVVTGAHAAELPVANTEYSAIRKIEMADGSMVQTVHHAFGKERVETTMADMAMVLIQRPDKKLAWQLMPMANMYTEIQLDQADAMAGNVPSDVTIDKVGAETIDGIETTKYKMLMKDKSAGGFLWLTKENIVLRMDFVSKDDGKAERVRMTLTELQIGKQDPKLFELPPGYSKMPGIGNLMPQY